MIALGDISRFEGEKESCKIIKPVWDVITDYLVIFLVLLSVVFAGMTVTSAGSFECLAVVDCPGKSILNASSSMLISHVKYRNVCREFYNSQKSNIVKRTYVVSDITSRTQYGNFVNSECRKSAIPNFLSYFWIFLFLQSFLLIVLDNLWLKIPTTASVIENFAGLVMDCYAAPIPNFTLTKALSSVPALNVHDDDDDNDINGDGISDSNQSYEFNILEDTATVNALKTLYEKVTTLKENVESPRIWRLYLIQGVLKAVCASVFLSLDLYYMKDLQEIMTCTINQYIPIPHDYFICSHSLAPTFVRGLKFLYLPTLGVAALVYFVVIGWTVSKVFSGGCFAGNHKCIYDFHKEKLPELVGSKVSDIHPVYEDLGFLVHLLHAYNKVYVVRLAHFLSKDNEKKVKAQLLTEEYPVSKLKKQLEENGNKLTFYKLPGIPPTIFELSTDIVELEFKKCQLENEDFENFSQLTSLRKLSIINCGLKSIPEGILKMEWLEAFSLKGNFVTSIDDRISNLKKLTTLDLSDNNLKSIPASFEELDNVFAVYLTGNPELQIPDLKVALRCRRLRILDSPRHLLERVHELNQLEQDIFQKAVKLAVKENFVIPYRPEDAPHINKKDDRIYKMNSCPKGIAVIINVFSYKNESGLRDRLGSDKDVVKLQYLFEEIGFKPLLIESRDCTSGEALKFLEVCVEDTTYQECDCIALILMCHGDEQGLIFSDGQCCPVIEFVERVQKSPLYQGKPKLFFIQSCRGTQVSQVSRDNTAAFRLSREASQISSEYQPLDVATDSVPIVANDADSSPHVMVERPAIPEGTDILLAYSTLPGYSSFRSIDKGSWYVSALVQIFSQHAWEEDILSLLTLVNYEVVRAYTSAGWRQVPAPQSTLTKKLYLFPGYPSQTIKPS